MKRIILIVLAAVAVVGLVIVVATRSHQRTEVVHVLNFATQVPTSSYPNHNAFCKLLTLTPLSTLVYKHDDLNRDTLGTLVVWAPSPDIRQAMLALDIAYLMNKPIPSGDYAQANSLIRAICLGV